MIEHFKELIAILPKISGSLSIIGSVLTARSVLKQWRSQQSNEHLPATTRVVANMCVADIGSSFWGHFMSTWMIPKRYYAYVAFAAGNEATCNAQAFLWYTFVVTEAGCNVCLAFTYYLTVCRQVSETELRSWKYQFLIMGWPWLFGIVMTLVLVILGGGGGPGIWNCAPYNGGRASLVLTGFIGLGFLIILFSMGCLIRTVYLTEKKMDRFCQGDSSRNREKTLQVSKQGVAYIAAYLVAFLPAVVTMIIAPKPRGWYIFYACVYPSQGVWNSLVFFSSKRSKLHEL